MRVTVSRNEQPHEAECCACGNQFEVENCVAELHNGEHKGAVCPMCIAGGDEGIAAGFRKMARTYKWFAVNRPESAERYQDNALLNEQWAHSVQGATWTQEALGWKKTCEALARAENSENN